VVRNPGVFSSKSGPAALPPPPEVVEIIRQGYYPVDTLLTNDPPSHGRYRALVNHAFTPRRVAVMETYMRDLAERLVDGFAARGRAELVGEFAVPLPLTIIADQLGVPRRDMGDFKRWSDDSVAALGGMISFERQLECARSIVEFQRYFEKRIEEVRRQPRDDMLSDLVQARLDGGDGLGLAELVSILQQILVAGNETTTNLISSAMMLLLRNPEQMRAVVADPSLIPNMIEEALRLESAGAGDVPHRHAGRRPRRSPHSERRAAGGPLRRRQPRPAPVPRARALRRAPRERALASGLRLRPTLLHRCRPGAQGRIVAFETLFARLRDFRLSAGADLAHQPSFILRGLRELSVEFTAR